MTYPTTIFIYTKHQSFLPILEQLHPLTRHSNLSILLIPTLEQEELSYPQISLNGFHGTYFLLHHSDETKSISTSYPLLICDEVPHSFLTNFPVSTKETYPIPILGLSTSNTDHSFIYPHKEEHNPLPSVPYLFESIESIDEQSISLVFCRYHHLPMHILQTKRLSLREWSTSDASQRIALYQSFPKETDLQPTPLTLEEQRDWLFSYIQGAYGFFEHGLWAVFLKDTDTLIGQCGIEYKERNGKDYYELQYMIAPEFQNNGYAYEICSAICNYAKENLYIEQLFAFIKKENLPSIKLIQKLGFSFHSNLFIEKEEFFAYSICFSSTFSI